MRLAASTFSSIVPGICLLAVVLFFFLPVAASAQGAIPTFKPHPVCVEWMAKPPKTRPPVQACIENSPLGPVVGTCVATQCKGESSPGLDGGSSSLSSQLTGIVGQLFQGVLQKLLQGGQGGSGSGDSGTGSTGTTGSTYTQLPTCSIYSGIVSSTATSVTVRLSWTSTDATSAGLSPALGSVPTNGSQEVTLQAATTYVLSVTGPGGQNVCSTSVLGPGGSGGSGTQTLSDLLNGGSTGEDTGTQTSVGTILSDIFGTNENVDAITASSTTTAGTQLTQTVQNNQASLFPFGTTGDIRVFESGATIVVSARDDATKTETAGFYGSTVTGGLKSTGVVGQMCQSRPWATNFLSKIVAPSFFDSLCSWRGYVVGTPATVQNTPKVTVTQTVPKAATTTTTVKATTTPTIEPKVSIWAVPKSVPLGARTSIFWNTQGVTNCVVSSPDGSFNQTTLSGGAATVPLVAATTFTISCMSPSGEPVTGFVTVNLSI